MQDSGTPSSDYRNDQGLRKAKPEQMLADGSGKQPLTSYWRDNGNRWGLFISCVLAMIGVAPLWFQSQSWISFITIIGIDVYILYLLVIIGLHADRRANTYKKLPHRLPAFAMGGLLFAGLLHAFGNLYLHDDIVCPQVSNCAVDGANSHIQKPGDALYFSTVTMTTLGYGDCYPGSRESRYIVIWQLGNSVLLVVLLLPLVMSRFATF